MKAGDLPTSISSFADVPRLLHPLDLRTVFNNVLFFTGKGYVLVWSDSEVEQLDTTILVGRLASLHPPGRRQTPSPGAAPRNLTVPRAAQSVLLTELSTVRRQTHLHVAYVPVTTGSCRRRRGDLDNLGGKLVQVRPSVSGTSLAFLHCHLTRSSQLVMLNRLGHGYSYSAGSPG